jgi:UDP-glucose 4-epimerase
MRILITGHSGYIGSHLTKILYYQGHELYGFSKLIDENDVSKYVVFETNYVRDIDLPLHYDVIIHLAAEIDIEESVKYPQKYYSTNVGLTLDILDNFVCKHFIFASTAAAFNPINPYGHSKVMAEQIIRDSCENYTIFRFFNVAGSNGEFRQIGKPTHLIRMSAMAAASKIPELVINGNDYDTRDGTCIRDYIHVEDLANSIAKSIDKPANSLYECLSLGRDNSNLEVINTMKRVAKDFKTTFGPNRPGDADVLIATDVSDYVIASKTLEDMCRSAHEMEMK